MAEEENSAGNFSKEEESQCSSAVCDDDSKAGYEYLDHTSDVQIHAWGETLTESFELAALAMIGYMTDLETVEVSQEQEVLAEGHDLESLLYGFLDEVLFLFCAEPFLTSKEIEILEFDKNDFKIKAICRGEPFDLQKHPQGTEIKAITYSNMQIYDDNKTNDIFVIVDI